ELVDLGDREARLEALPDLGPEPRAEDRLDAVRALLGVRRRVVEVSAELADVHEVRRAESLAVLPMTRGRELPPHGEGRAPGERHAPAEHDAARVVHRETRSVDDVRGIDAEQDLA